MENGIICTSADSLFYDHRENAKQSLAKTNLNKPLEAENLLRENIAHPLPLSGKLRADQTEAASAYVA